MSPSLTLVYGHNTQVMHSQPFEGGNGGRGRGKQHFPHMNEDDDDGDGEMDVQSLHHNDAGDDGDGKSMTERTRMSISQSYYDYVADRLAPWTG